MLHTVVHRRTDYKRDENIVYLYIIVLDITIETDDVL